MSMSLANCTSGLRSERVALGYWNNEQATRGTFVDGWVRTGDIARVDDNGGFLLANLNTSVWWSVVTNPFLREASWAESRIRLKHLLAAKYLPPDRGRAAHWAPGTRCRCPRRRCYALLRSEGEKGTVPRAWIVLSDEGKKVGADVVIKELEVWYQKKLSEDKWLHGGIEIVDEVCMAPSFNKAHLMIQIFNVDTQVSIRKAVKSSIAEKLWWRTCDWRGRKP